MENAQAQIEELKQELTLLREQLAITDAKMAICQADLRAQKNAAKSQITRLWKAYKDLTGAQDLDRTHSMNHIDYFYKRFREIDDCLWPVMREVFPKYSEDMKRITELIGEPVLPRSQAVPTRDGQ